MQFFVNLKNIFVQAQHTNPDDPEGLMYIANQLRENAEHWAIGAAVKKQDQHNRSMQSQNQHKLNTITAQLSVFERKAETFGSQLGLASAVGTQAALPPTAVSEIPQLPNVGVDSDDK
jgi:hypothetical protein